MCKDYHVMSHLITTQLTRALVLHQILPSAVWQFQFPTGLDVPGDIFPSYAELSSAHVPNIMLRQIPADS